MPDSKITALTALTAADPANDMIPIVDVSDTPPASGNTKRISINNILAASGTATLASATITGDLTVDTSTLKVDSALNKVGVGVATLTGLQTFNVAGDVGITSDLVLKNSGGTAQGYIFGSSGLNYRVIAGQPHVWQEGGSDLMRLNSTGLGIGVAPSAWGSNYRAVEVSGAVNVFGATTDGNLAGIGANLYHNNTNYLYRYATFATMYLQDNGTHQWHTAPSGTAGNAITFDQAMTLDASGRLLVNTASVIGGSGDTLQIAGKTTAGTDYCSMYTGTSTTVYGARYYHTSAVVGSITFTASGTAYNIASDYRLKEAVAPLTGGLARVSALKPSIYKWKVNGSDGEGFIAHELAEVIPAAVTGQKDAVNEDGSIQPQQVDLSKVVPVLVAAIQELTARVQTLETR